MRRMRVKIFIFFTVLSMVISAVLFFANSAPVLKMIIDKYAPKYNITYKSIEGNLIRDLHIRDIRYKNEPLVKNATLSWSPWALLEGQVFLHTLDLEDADIGVVKKMVKELQSDDNTTKKKERIGLDIAVKNVNITLLPFDLTKEIKIDKSKIKASEFIFSIKELKVVKGALKASLATNYGAIDYDGIIGKKTEKERSGTVHFDQTLFDRYHIPLKADALQDVTIQELDLNDHKLLISLEAKGKGALFAKGYPIDITDLSTSIIYDFDVKKLTINSQARLQNKEFEQIALTNKLIFDGSLYYEGELIPQSFVFEPMQKLFTGMRIKYFGNTHLLDANITSDLFGGSFKSKEYKEGRLKFTSKEPILLASYFKLPKKLRNAFFTLAIDTPIDLHDLAKNKINAQLRSNVANIDVSVAPNSTLDTRAKLFVPKDTLLKNYNDTINWYLLDNAKMQAKKGQNGWDMALQAKGIALKALYNDRKIDGTITLDAKPFGALRIDTNAAFAVNIEKKMLQIASKNLKIGDKKIDQKEIKDVKFQMTQNGEGTFVLDSYSFNFKDVGIFATKPSYFDIKNDQFTLKELWINDQALLKGSYDLVKKKGNFRLDADSFELESKLADVRAAFGFDLNFDHEKSDISGSLNIIDGEVKYNFEQKSFPSDSDIIIIQDIHHKQPSTFTKNLTTNIKLTTLHPVRYRQKNADITFQGDLGINKTVDTSSLVTGMVTIPKGSSYLFRGKRFIFKQSHIYFVGEYNKPLLDISAECKVSDYKITVFITGTPNTPNIIFSSRPRLSQEQILALLLFGSQDAAGTHSSSEMMKMIGGAIAKSALQDAGIKVDHLVLGADTFEVGKKISDKVTIIYVNEEVSKVKLKYDQSKTVEEVLTVSPESTSIDIFYKKEFENMGDILYSPKD